jgi:hypothetical protein
MPTLSRGREGPVESIPLDCAPGECRERPTMGRATSERTEIVHCAEIHPRSRRGARIRREANQKNERTMRLAAIAALCAVPVLCATRAYAAPCQFKSEPAVYCLAGDVAAAAYNRFGRDNQSLRMDNVREVLHEGMCGVWLPQSATARWTVEPQAHTRIATLDRYVGITWVKMHTHGSEQIAWTADQYLTGNCAAPEH